MLCVVVFPQTFTGSQPESCTPTLRYTCTPTHPHTHTHIHICGHVQTHTYTPILPKTPTHAYAPTDTLTPKDIGFYSTDKSHKCIRRSKVRKLYIVTQIHRATHTDRHTPEPSQILSSSITSYLVNDRLSLLTAVVLASQELQGPLAGKVVAGCSRETPRWMEPGC